MRAFTAYPQKNERLDESTSGELARGTDSLLRSTNDEPEWDARSGASDMTSQTITAEGFAYDANTRDWTKRVEYVARDRMEAIRWMNFQRDWFKNLRITTPPIALRTRGTFYTV